MEAAISYRQILWLRRVLLLKSILCFVVWGLPVLLAPPALLTVFGFTGREDPVFLRLSGALIVAFGVAYWYAYRDPVRNSAIVRVGVVDNGLVTLTIVALGLTVGMSIWFLWVSAVLTAFLCVSLFLLMPGE